MIFRRPSPCLLGVLLALSATATVGYAETEPAAGHASPAATPPTHESPAPESSVLGSTGAEPATAPVEAATEKKETPAHAGKPANPSHLSDGPREEILSLLKLGGNLTERGDWAAAEIAFRQVMTARKATDEDLANALLGLARVYRKQGSLTKAAAIYEKFIKDYSAHDQVPDALLELGRTHRALGAYQLALARFYSVINSTLKLSSEGFTHYQVLAKTAQFEIAETHFQLGDYAEANKFFSRLRLLDLAPADRARAHFKSAYALYLGNDFENAVTTLHSYLEQWPRDENVPEARYLLSLSLRTLGRKQEALDATLQLLRGEQSGTDPKRWIYWQRRTGNQLANEFFQAGDTLNALVIYQGLAALSPEPAWRLPATYQIALCYERMRLNDRAAAAYQSIVDAAKPPTEAAAEPKSGAEPKPAAEPAKPANAELAELVRMASWRLTQLNWHEQTEHQLSSLFTPGTDPAAKAPPTPTLPAANIEHTAPSQPAATPAHDQPGKPAPAPANL